MHSITYTLDFKFSITILQPIKYIIINSSPHKPFLLKLPIFLKNGRQFKKRQTTLRRDHLKKL